MSCMVGVARVAGEASRGRQPIGCIDSDIERETVIEHQSAFSARGRSLPDGAILRAPRIEYGIDGVSLEGRGRCAATEQPVQ